MKESILIGGAGFIGTHLAIALLNSGRAVTVIDREESLILRNFKKINFVTADFSNLDLIDKYIQKDVEVIHLAYSTSPNTSFDNPLLDLNQNLSPVLNLLDKICERNASFIFLSSGGAVYGEAKHIPIKENHPTHPISPYGVTKLTIENYAHLYCVTKGLRYFCIRPANPYGIGQFPFRGQGFISTSIASLLTGKALSIYGASGTVRDYIYIDDLVEGIIKVLNSRKSNQTYNVGCGVGLTNMDIINAIIKLLALDPKSANIQYFPARPFDVGQNILDTTKLRHETGWTAKVDLSSGLKIVIPWIRTLL